ncbi:glycosyltransferase [Occultella glacieicola]|uniref:Glycosyltransferase n=1 Tax=Occultella glacieicola TaxID=2518684 RepID=A0ABY2E6E0_9MICO|nr:glycosyltransferase [Occultella glacieicola]TDE96153.1 glycosyltransferase [Occultella glacieicola]
MVVNHDIVADARVRKSAQSVQRLGFDVTLLYGLQGITEPVRGTLGDVATLGIPQPYGMTATKAKLERERRAYRSGFPGFISESDLEWARYQNTLAGLRASRYALPVRALLRLPRMFFDWRVRFHERREERIRAYWEQQADPDAVPRRLDWRREVTQFSDLSLSFTREIWRQKPDIIHAHDAHVLKAAVNATNHMRAHRVRPTLIYDAHEFVVGAVRTSERQRRAWAQMEKHYTRAADGVITVSESIADALQRVYRLPDRPTVVLNAPVVEEIAEAPSDIRTDCGLGRDVPLLAYSGSMAEKRGVATVVEALTFLPEVHLAVICVPSVSHKLSRELARRATELGVVDRVHLLEPVKPEEVLSYLRSADVGVHPMIGDIPNHEMALPNKLFDYIFAGLPIVVSDLQEMGAFVRRTAVGETFSFGDAADCARALKEVFGALPEYRAKVTGNSLENVYSWESQEGKLAELYARVGG